MTGRLMAMARRKARSGWDEQQRQDGEQPAAGTLNAVALQWASCQRRKAVARQQQEQQHQEPDHRSRHRQAEPAHKDFADQLAEQDEAEAGDHE
jgi:hypothetical protein